MNINGLNKKVIDLSNTLKSYDVDVCLLSETHRPNLVSRRKLKDAGYTSFFNTIGGNAGTGIVIRDKLKDFVVKNDTIIKGRIQFLSLKIRESMYNLYCVYLQSGEKNTIIENGRYARPKQIKELHDHAKLNIDKDEQIVIGGDFNFVEKAEIDRLSTESSNACDLRNQEAID